MKFDRSFSNFSTDGQLYQSIIATSVFLKKKKNLFLLSEKLSLFPCHTCVLKRDLLEKELACNSACQIGCQVSDLVVFDSFKTKMHYLLSRFIPEKKGGKNKNKQTNKNQKGSTHFMI